MAGLIQSSTAWRAPTGALLMVSAVVLCAAVTAGCSSPGGSSMTFFADPGKYQYHNCAQLETEKRAQAAREKELRELIARAQQSTGGTVVGVMAYRSDYQTAAENLRL